MFTQAETDYLNSQRLARIATVGANSQPDVVPVGFEFNGGYFYVGGRNMLDTRKFKNVSAGRVKVAIVVDDLASVAPWRPRGIRVYGTAEIVDHQGYAGRGKYLRITPEKAWSWGL
jgi:pyridoxamine 5'-phosphate oxidase family protein